MTVKVKVKCYEGYKGSEKPTEFQLGDQVVSVAALLDQWYEPDCNYFKIKAGDGNIYILKHSFEEEWTLVSFRKEDVN